MCRRVGGSNRRSAGTFRRNWSMAYEGSKGSYIPFHVVLHHEVMCWLRGTLESAVGLEEELFEVRASDCGIYDSTGLAVAAFAFFVIFVDRVEACVVSLRHHDGRDLDVVLPFLHFAKFLKCPFDSTDFDLDHF